MVYGAGMLIQPPRTAATPDQEMPMTENSDSIDPQMLQQPFEEEIARLLVETLQLEMDPSEIEPEQPLFNEGLGLDSIDALEIALAIAHRYGLDLKSEDERNERIFASLRSLSRYVETQRAR